MPTVAKSGKSSSSSSSSTLAAAGGALRLTGGRSITVTSNAVTSTSLNASDCTTSSFFNPLNDDALTARACDSVWYPRVAVTLVAVDSLRRTRPLVDWKAMEGPSQLELETFLRAFAKIARRLFWMSTPLRTMLTLTVKHVLVGFVAAVVMVVTPVVMTWVGVVVALVSAFAMDAVVVVVAAVVEVAVEVVLMSELVGEVVVVSVVVSELETVKLIRAPVLVAAVVVAILVAVVFLPVVETAVVVVVTVVVVVVVVAGILVVLGVGLGVVLFDIIM